jgi:hypothetical protein
MWGSERRRPNRAKPRKKGIKENQESARNASVVALFVFVD